MYKLFVDLDGVLVDFERGVREVTGKDVSAQTARDMWKALARNGSFYTHLHWLEGGARLWDFAKKHEPVILTGLPWGGWAEAQKREWCARELGPEVPVITCMSRDKATRGREATPEGMVPVLVDDRERIKESWIEMGGIFVHHTSAETSLEQLKALLDQGS